MKARYLGYPGDAAEESPLYVTHLGVTFRRDRWATLPATVTAPQLAKLQVHPHFEVAEGEGEDVQDDEAPKPAEEAGPKPAGTKAEIVAKLQAVANAHPGFEFNPKASAKDLAAKLEEAEFEYGDE
jgi:hypothetical protein